MDSSPTIIPYAKNPHFKRTQANTHHTWNSKQRSKLGIKISSSTCFPVAGFWRASPPRIFVVISLSIKYYFSSLFLFLPPLSHPLYLTRGYHRLGIFVWSQYLSALGALGNLILYFKNTCYLCWCCGCDAMRDCIIAWCVIASARCVASCVLRLASCVLRCALRCVLRMHCVSSCVLVVAVLAWCWGLIMW